MRLREEYEPRPVAPLGVEIVEGWRLKLYGISYGLQRPRQELVEAALAAAAHRLPQPPLSESRYGVGFLGIHDGRDGNFVFVDWWERENELHHHVFLSSPDEPGELRAAAEADPIACAWDLAVIAHERDAWVRHVLANAGGPSMADYLADQLSGCL
jgi:hypothetical protein